MAKSYEVWRRRFDDVYILVPVDWPDDVEVVDGWEVMHLINDFIPIRISRSSDYWADAVRCGVTSGVQEFLRSLE